MKSTLLRISRLRQLCVSAKFQFAGLEYQNKQKKMFNKKNIGKENTNRNYFAFIYTIFLSDGA